MIDKYTVTLAGGTYDIRLYDGPRLAGGDLGLSHEAAVSFLRDELSMGEGDAECELYSADQMAGQPREFWV